MNEATKVPTEQATTTEQGGTTGEALTTAETAPVKKRGRGGKYNFPSTVDPATVDADKNRATLREVLLWYDRGHDRPTTDAGIYDRIREYFESCLDRGARPTVEAMCLALGYARTTVTEWKQGMKCSPERATIIKNAFDAFAAFDAGAATSGDLNPILYFFRAKNYYSMRDQADVVVTAAPAVSEEAVDAVAARYAALPED